MNNYYIFTQNYAVIFQNNFCSQNYDFSLFPSQKFMETQTFIKSMQT